MKEFFKRAAAQSDEWKTKLAVGAVSASLLIATVPAWAQWDTLSQFSATALVLGTALNALVAAKCAFDLTLRPTLVAKLDEADEIHKNARNVIDQFDRTAARADEASRKTREILANPTPKN